jgi:hypothetical protein
MSLEGIISSVFYFSSLILSAGTSDGSNRSGYVLLGSRTRLILPQEKIVAEKVKAIQSEVPIYVATINKSNCFAFVSYETSVS